MNVIGDELLYGYSVEIQNRYKGAFHCFVKFPGIFHQHGISGHTREKLTVQIDCEPQNINYKAEIVILNKFDIFMKINAVPPDVLLSQKIFAILNRPRPRERDFYDVIFLFSKNISNQIQSFGNYDLREIRTLKLIKYERKYNG